jgi:ribulose 1,5-bisphosphate synthetase/thiazole synthase
LSFNTRSDDDSNSPFWISSRGPSHRLYATSLSQKKSNGCSVDVAIVGGGLAGLGLAHHLLEMEGVNITIYDKAEVGQGGASSVAGG